MRQVVIIGNSGAARECYALFQDILQAMPSMAQFYAFRGFLSWKAYPGNLKRHAEQLLADADAYSLSQDDIFVIGIGDPELRRAIYCAFKERGASFLTLIHPWSDVAPDVHLGEGNILQRGTRVASGCTIGSANYFNGAVHIAPGVTVGDYNFVGPGALLLEKSRLGSRNSLGVRSILQVGSSIGDGNMITPGSVVCGAHGDRSRMAGNPAVVLGEMDR
ncbi:transferase [Desulfovibrio sp.]|uniref:transferase n=1 Tax=Desulfovibrio sp. TaxID=885 RepID=UPI0025BD6A48|nr:transferase [Desulfovibrio sp.]MCI7569536.1 transferase [Desulfovibrio sp.]